MSRSPSGGRFRLGRGFRFGLGAALALGVGQPAAALPIAWNTNASGDWSVAANWSAGVPTAADDVTIDRGAANPTITHGAPAASVVGSLVNREALVVSGGTLDTGAFTAGAGSSLSVSGSGVRFAASGATLLDGSSIFSSNGGLADLSAATSYASGSAGRTLQASGVNVSPSTLDLSGVTALAGATGVNAELRVNALAGGFVDLGGVTSLANSSVVFRANGSGSVIDLSGLTTFTDTGSSLDISGIEASDGGSVLLATGPLSISGYSLLRRGATSGFDTSSLTTLTNSSVEASGPGTSFDLSSLTSFGGNSFFARDGASLVIGGASYASGAAGRTLEADGVAGATASLLDGSSLTTLSGATGLNAELRVNALAGGFVDLGGVTSLANSSVVFRANGAGSAIDLSGLTTFTDTGSSLDISGIEASDGGSVLLPASGPLSISGYSLLRRGSTSGFDTSALTTLANSSVEASGPGTSFDLSSLTSFDGNSFFARDGASLLIGGTSYASGSLGRTLEADGIDGATASLLDASSLTALSGATGLNAELRVNALAGGLVDLGGVTSLADSSVIFRANGAGSAIDLSRLTTLTDTGADIDISGIEASEGGTVLLGAGQPLSISGYSLLRRGATSSFDTAALTTLTDSSVEASGPGTSFDLSSLTSFDGNSFLARDGASLVISDTSYATGVAGRTLEANGIDGGTASLLDGSSLTSLAGATGLNAELRVNALAGGFVDLGGVVSLADSSVEFRANGAGSAIDLTGLTAFADTGTVSDVSLIEVSSGGTLLLSPQPISVDGYWLVVQGAASTLDATSITRLANSQARVSGVGAVLDLSSIASADTNSFLAEAGAELSVPTTSYAAGPGGGRFLRAFGASGGVPSRIDGSSLGSLAGSTGPGTSLLLEADEGGVVDLGALASIDGGGVRVEASGAGSRIDLSSLGSFVDTNGTSRITSATGGEVRLAQAGTTALAGVDLIASSTGTITGREVQALAGTRIRGEGSLDLGRIELDGGLLTPGTNDDAADLFLNGDLAQTAAGVIEIDLTGILALEYDRVDVFGTATLGGEIRLDLVAFDPAVGDSFDVLGAASIVDAGFFAPSSFGDARFWTAEIVNVAAQEVLRMTVVPEPSPLALLAFAVAVCAGWRRARSREGSRLHWLWAGAALWLAPAAQAGDGVLEIAQVCAAGPGCFAGDGPGFPVEITAPGSYRLTTNLTVPNENTSAITLGADEVTLDLGGFSIAGTTSCSGSPLACTPAEGTGVGIDGAASDRSAVRNGAARGLGFVGVRLGERALIERLVVRENRTHGLLVGGGAVIAGVNATNNGTQGIETGGASSVADTIAISNGQNGIRAGTASVLSSCSSFGNGRAGMRLEGGVVSHAIANSNAGDGIEAVLRSAIARSSAAANGEAGIAAGSDAAVRHCVARANAGTGLEGAGFGYRDCVVSANGGTVSSLGTPTGDNLCDASTTCP